MMHHHRRSSDPTGQAASAAVPVPVPVRTPSYGGGEEDPDPVGFDSQLFDVSVDDSLVCMICQNVIEDAAELQCGHLFCSEHIAGWLSRGNRTCPTCRAPVIDEPRKGSAIHLTYRQRFSELRAHCRHREHGCTARLQPSEIRKHEASCAHAPGFCRLGGARTHTHVHARTCTHVHAHTPRQQHMLFG
eukprot:m.168758 g.168758  ORF g.168758 m.168758 type:complete len:188 (-) comp17794_c2_seq1:1046-1609(-)